MKYWVSYGLFQFVEFFSDITLIYIMPFYYEIKLALILWLVHGTKLVYDSIVNRELTKREKTIDKWLTRINKYRDEIIALVWFEISRCSVRIIAALMSSGMSVLTQPRDDGGCFETSPSIMNTGSNHNNNNDANFRRSKRLIKIEEIHPAEDSDTEQVPMETDDCEHELSETGSSNATVQYAIVD
jgi:hypothetical protein